MLVASYSSVLVWAELLFFMGAGEVGFLVFYVETQKIPPVELSGNTQLQCKTEEVQALLERSIRDGDTATEV